MNWWRRWFGLDPVDLVVHFAIGGFLIGVVANVREPEADILSLLMAAGVLVVYAWRRRRALGALGPMGLISGEVRIAELDAQAEEIHDLRVRMAELEERQDFSERLLARKDGAGASADR